MPNISDTQNQLRLNGLATILSARKSRANGGCECVSLLMILSLLGQHATSIRFSGWPPDRLIVRRINQQITGDTG